MYCIAGGDCIRGIGRAVQGCSEVAPQRSGTIEEGATAEHYSALDSTDSHSATPDTLHTHSPPVSVLLLLLLWWTLSSEEETVRIRGRVNGQRQSAEVDRWAGHTVQHRYIESIIYCRQRSTSTPCARRGRVRADVVNSDVHGTESFTSTRSSVHYTFIHISLIHVWGVSVTHGTITRSRRR